MANHSCRRKYEMGRLPQLNYILLSLLMFAANIFPQWEQLKGPYGGFATCFSAKGEYLFALGGSVFRSSDNGSNWMPANLGLPYSEYNHTLISSGENIFTLVDGVVYISITNGNSWYPISNVSSTPYFQALAVKGDVLYAAGIWSGFYSSTNNGFSWSKISDDLANQYITQLIVEGNNIYAGTNEGIYLSTNYGVNWVAVNKGLTNKYIQTLAVKDSTIFAATGGGLYRSTNNGGNWAIVNNGISNPDVRAVVISGTNIFAAAVYDGVYISRNNGASWTLTDKSLTNITVNTLFAKNGTVFVGTSTGGIFKSTNNGNSWIQSNNGFMFPKINTLAAIGKRIFSGTENNRAFYADDPNTGWTQMNNLQSTFTIRSFAINGTSLFAAGSGIYRSNDNGLTWTNSFSGLGQTDVSVITNVGNKLYAGTYGPYGGINISTNNGSSWSLVNIGIAEPFIYDIAGYGKNIFASFRGNGIFRSTDNGVTWLQSNNVLLPYQIYSLAADSNKVLAGSDNVVYLSTDYGGNWTPCGNLGGKVSSIRLFKNNIFVITNNNNSLGNVFLSGNNGVTWSNQNFGLPKTTLTSLLINGDYVYVGSEKDGIWRRQILEMITESKTEKLNLPANFLLMQNYPNPCNPTTTIKFEIPREGKVSLVVYNTLSQKVKELVNEIKPAGSYQVTMDGANMPSGIYFYQLTTGSFSQTKKLLLLK